MRMSQILRLKLIIFLIMVFSFTVSVGIVCAETQYVSDELVITLRGGKGSQYKIIKTLKTGTPLEILEESEGYLRVITEDGIEGWALKQYITGETPKSVIIAGLERKIARLNREIKQYKEDSGSLQNQLSATKSDHNKMIRDLRQNVSTSEGKAEQTDRELKGITERYNALMKDSKDVIQIVKERDSLKRSNSELITDTDRLRNENDDLKRSQMIWWFLAGGGVFFVGWIVGKISRQKRFY